MEFRQLRHFLAVFDQGSYVRAAEALELTQQAVSASVAKLEASIQTELFKRDRSGVTLTVAGEALVPYARMILHDSDRALETMDRLARGQAGRIRIGVAQAPVGAAVPKAILRLQKERPGVEVQAITGLAHDLKTRLSQGELDMVMGAPLESWQVEPDLQLEELIVPRTFVVCGASHPLATRNEVSLQELRHYPWILPPPDSLYTDFLLDAFAKGGVEPAEAVIYSDSYAIGVALVDLGHHLVLVMEGMLDVFLDRGVFVALPIELNFPAIKGCIAYRKDALLSEPARYFLSLVKDEVSKSLSAARI